MKENIEHRSFVSTQEFQFRALEEDGTRFIEGYAATFDTRSKLMPDNGRVFYEEIRQGAFTEALEREDLDVFLTLNHSKDKVMARTVNNTLTLTEDDKGLYFRAEIVPVSYAEDTWELVRNGTLFENSFGMLVLKKDVTFTRTEDGTPLRIINKVTRLVDVSVVTNASYPNTEVLARQLEEFEREEAEAEVETETEEVKEEVVEKEVEDLEIDEVTDDEIEKLKMKIKI